MSYSDTLFIRSILQKRAADTEEYRKAVEVALDCYYGLAAQRKYLDPGNKMTESTWARIEPVMTHTNVTAMIAQRLGGGMYENTPTREVVDKEKDELVTRLKDAFEYSEAYVDMDEIAALRALTGNILLVPAWDDIDKETKVDIYTPDQFRAVQNEVYPDRADAYLMSWSQTETFGAGTAKLTRDGWWVVEGDMLQNNVLQQKPILHPETGEPWEDVHPIRGLFPVVHLKYQRQLGVGTIFGSGLMHELVQANNALNLLVAAFNVLAKDTGLTTLVIKNVQKEDMEGLTIGTVNSVMRLVSTIADPNTGTVLPADAEYISPSTGLESLNKAVEACAGAIFSRFGIRNQNPLRIDMSNPESGIAKWLADADVRAKHKKQIPGLMKAEKELAHYWMIADCVGRNKPIPPWLRNWDYDYKIQFNLGSPTYNISEQVIRDEWLRNQGVRNEVDVLMETNPDVKGRPEAIEKIVELAVENNEIKRRVAAAMPKPEPVSGTFNKLGITE